MEALISELPRLRSRSTTERPLHGWSEEAWQALECDVGLHAARLSKPDREALEEVLFLDLSSEFDARFYSIHVRQLGIELSSAFLNFEPEWARDEAKHMDGFRRTLKAGFGWSEQRMAELNGRRSNFEPLAHLFRDEFAILCLSAYDELATVRAYLGNMHHYRKLGPAFLRFLRSVIADEGWHYSRFLDVIRKQHAHRLGEARSMVQEIRSAEGTPYASTFVLDHDDDVWSDAIFDEAEQVLLRALERAQLGSHRTPAPFAPA